MAENSCAPNFSEDCNDDEGNTITMVDVLEEEKKLEEDANAVLGGSDDKNCTYNEGYVKRQALYACMTCLPADKGVAAGVCLACSYQCHEGHDLIELYTKRNFRCDCGNSNFSNKTCSLEPNKHAVNDQNRYNQNFQGLYCTCKRPYPDPDDEISDEMIQCIVCEDWFHTRHLGAEMPSADNYSEMICGLCSDNLKFLHYYLGHAVTRVTNSTGDDSVVKVEDKCEDATNTSTDTPAKIEVNIDEVDTSQLNNQSGENCDISGTKQDSDGKSDANDCLLKSLSLLEKPKASATFWPESFRKLLCTCCTCQEMYKSKGVEFLIDPLDTVQAYEEEGKNKLESGASSQYERGLLALSGMDRTKQVEAILQYNDMMQHLNGYLAKFAENKKVVRKEDINEFFSGMKARKRQKVEIPHFCH